MDKHTGIGKLLADYDPPDDCRLGGAFELDIGAPAL